MEDVEKVILIYLGKHGDVALRVGHEVPKDVYRFFHEQLRDYFLRREQARRDSSYHPIWNPIQRAMAKVDWRHSVSMKLTFDLLIEKKSLPALK